MNELERAKRTASPLAIAYVDVVGLKAVNDTMGHAAGDTLLKHVVAHLTAHLRPYDLIIRLGGDEFLCAMPNLALASARAEAFKAFGDPTVFLEKVVSGARHVEVQIIADQHGTTWAALQPFPITALKKLEHTVDQKS